MPADRSAVKVRETRALRRGVASIDRDVGETYSGAAPVKRNITLTLDDDLLRKARVLAEQDGIPLSALLRQQLEKIIHERDGYEQAKRRALARLKRGYNLG
jgi:hypothetical protein